MRRKTRRKTVDKTALYLALSEIILSSLGENVGDLVCVPLETYRNIVRKVETISPEAAEKLEEKWKAYIVRHSVRGLKVMRLQHYDSIPWDALTVRCRSQHHTMQYSTGISPTDVAAHVGQLLSLIPSDNTAEKLIIILDTLFTLRLDGETFKEALKHVLCSLLPPDCETVNLEHYFATGARLDLYVDCTGMAVVFEIKTPEEGTIATASHNPLLQAARYAKLLARHHRDKPIAVIIVRTDGKTPTELLARALRENLEEEAREAIHTLSKDNLKPILEAARRITREDKAKLTAEKLLELIAEGRIDTVDLAARNLSVELHTFLI
ncbi:hypothetical protein [Pyrodictium abyssi]|uniref:Uncharacterized protein n=1 Tax=Pyrodictium abyssi TaxID=54256 RepID=A0ABM8IYK0_9CREN|nr:hypothetical protein PABY_12970 [Pyrodictium abyssi]